MKKEYQSEIVPLYLYFNTHTNSSYLSWKKLKKSFSERNYLQFVIKFYVISPKFFPIPNGMNMLYIKKDSQHSIIEIGQLHDPFLHKDKNILKFIAWINPTPYTTPIYVYTKENSVFLSPIDGSQSKDYTEAIYSPIYVLYDPESSKDKISYRVPAITGTHGKFTNNQYLFINEQGRCIPDPKGMPMDECVVLYDKGLISKKNKDYSLLEELISLKNEKRHILYIILVCIVILIFIIILIRNK